MKHEQFTLKAREVIADAQRLAGEKGNPEIRPQHLLFTLLDQKKGVVENLIRQTGVDFNQFKREAAKLVSDLPSAQGGRARTSRTF